MSRRSRRTYWCMDCSQWAVPGPYMKCEDCAGDDHVDTWPGHPHQFTLPGGRELCTQCHTKEARATGPECLDCYFSPGGVFDTRRPAVRTKPTQPVHPIPAAGDEMTYHTRYMRVTVPA